LPKSLAILHAFSPAICLDPRLLFSSQVELSPLIVRTRAYGAQNSPAGYRGLPDEALLGVLAPAENVDPHPSTIPF
jgi:hypothetical protein